MERRRIAVVTGASAGVGRATAKLLAQSGFDVALLALGGGNRDGAANEVASSSLFTLRDVSDDASNRLSG